MKRTRSTLVLILFCCGSMLMLLNTYGEFRSLGPEWQAGTTSALMAHGERKFPTEVDFALIADCDRVEMFERINLLTHRQIRHLFVEETPEAGRANWDVPEPLNFGVPPWENFILYSLRLINPGTYTDYEFCDYEKAFERGFGDCGQKATAVVSFLDQQGIECGFISWPGHHAVALAKASENEWWLLDPDYGIAFPYDRDLPRGSETDKLPDLALAMLNAHPSLADLPHLDGSALLSAGELYPADGRQVDYGGPEARWGRAYWIERLAYIMKWVLPALMLLPFLLRSYWSTVGVPSQAHPQQFVAHQVKQGSDGDVPDSVHSGGNSENTGQPIPRVHR